MQMMPAGIVLMEKKISEFLALKGERIDQNGLYGREKTKVNLG